MKAGQALWTCVLVAILMAGCGSPGAAPPGPSVEEGDEIPALASANRLLLEGCEAVLSHGRVQKSWLEPLVPAGFVADNEGFETTTAGLEFFRCDRVVLDNNTYSNVGFADSFFGVDLVNETWGSNLTVLMLDLCSDNPALVAALQAMDIPIEVGEVRHESSDPLGVVEDWSAQFNGTLASLRVADHDQEPFSAGAEYSSWTVGETARRWDVVRTSSDANPLTAAASLTTLAGGGRTHAMFGNLDAFPVTLSMYSDASYETTFSGRFSPYNA